MSWYQDMWMARMIAEEKVTPRRRKEQKARSKFSAAPLRPLLRALLSWLF